MANQTSLYLLNLNHHELVTLHNVFQQSIEQDDNTSIYFYRILNKIESLLDKELSDDPYATYDDYDPYAQNKADDEAWELE